MHPATAGKALTEQELRAYIKCSQLFHYGGTVKPSLSSRMLQHATEYWMAMNIRDPDRSRSYIMSRALTGAVEDLGLRQTHMVGQIESLQNHAALAMDEFLTLFTPDKYLPVSGALPWRIKINKSILDLRLSGIFKTMKNQTLHLLSFTPYKDRHSQINDPITHLKLHALKELISPHNQRPQAVLHLIWARENGALGYDSIDPKNLNPLYLDMIKAKVGEIERGVHFPVLPCRFSCKFKNNCFPGGKK